MSVDFETCESCNETFCMCGPHSSYETCEVYLCGNCADKFGLKPNLCSSEYLKRKGYENYGLCSYCHGDWITNSQLSYKRGETLKLCKETLLFVKDNGHIVHFGFFRDRVNSTLAAIEEVIKDGT